MPLTVKECQNFKPGIKPYKKYDGNSLYLEVYPTGSKYWRYKYHFGGKEKKLAIGVYPDVSLADARLARSDAQKSLREGIDPNDVKKLKKIQRSKPASINFKKSALSWYEHKVQSWHSDTSRKAKTILDTYLIPKLGNIPISTISSADCKPVLLEIHNQAPSMAIKASQYCAQIIQTAIQDDLREDGRLLNLKGILPSIKTGHMASVTTEKDLSSMLEAISRIKSPHAKAAIVLCLYTAMRPGACVQAEWSEFNADFTEWLVPKSKMKGNLNDFITPIPSIFHKHLKVLASLRNGSKYLFPGELAPKTSHMHRDSLSKCLRDNGLRDITVTHGFRATFRSLGREILGIQNDVLETQLAHEKKGDVEKAYNRTKLLAERHEAVDKWSTYLNTLQDL